VTGSIVFHTRDGDFALQPGDRLEVDPGTEHAATVGDDGVLCLEAAAQCTQASRRGNSSSYSGK
jgi:mannose-6-phosphate isomerase-like protein (cupin superfamily)